MRYYIHQRIDGIFVLAKFEDDRVRPVDVYLLNKEGGACTCPSWKYPCKHVAIVNRWLEHTQPAGVIYNDKTDEFEANPFTADLEALKRLVSGET